MAVRGRQHHRSDMFEEYDSREYSHRGRSTLHDHQRHYKDPKQLMDKVNNYDRRMKQNKHREVLSSPHDEAPAYRVHDQTVLPREMSAYHSEAAYIGEQHSQCDLRYAITVRGMCQMMEIFLNLLIIICAGVPYSNNGGYRDLASFGGIYAYYFGGANAFTGVDAQRVQELDQLFHQLKRPPYVFAMACGGILMIYACAILALGVFKVQLRRPFVLLGEAIVNFLIGLGYIAGVAIFFVKVQETYQNPICKEREQMYKLKGHRGFDCQFHGADIAVGLFGVAGVFLFIFVGVLAVRAFRSIQNLEKEGAEGDNAFELPTART